MDVTDYGTEKSPILSAAVDCAITCAAVAAAFLVGAVIIRVSGASVTEAYGGLFSGMFGSVRAMAETCVASTPYMLTGLAVAVGFRQGLFNIGAEGQFYMGALFAAVTGFSLGGLSSWLHLPIAIGAGLVGGGLWGSIPGYLKARFGAHEVINTIMLNYIAVNLVDYAVKNVFRDPMASVDRTPPVLETAWFPKILGPDYRLHAGFAMAVVLAVFLAWMLKDTTFGFKIRVIRENPEAARYAGIRVSTNTVLVMTLSGALAGLGGAGEVLGLEHGLPAAFSAGYGYDAIAVAFLARANPVAVIPAALLWGGLKNGSGLMQIRSGISVDLVDVLQALVIVFVAAEPFARKMCRMEPARGSKRLFTRGWGQ